MSIDLLKFLETAQFTYDPKQLDILDEDQMFVAQLGSPKLVHPTDSLIHAQGRLLAAAPELRRRLESILILYREHCPKRQRNDFAIERAQSVLDSFFDPS